MKMFSDSKIEGQSRQCKMEAPQLVHLFIDFEILASMTSKPTSKPQQS